MEQQPMIQRSRRTTWQSPFEEQVLPILPRTWNQLVPWQFICRKKQEAGDGAKLAGIGLAGGLRAPVRRSNGGKCQR
jgi:hypothetical protein